MALVDKVDIFASYACRISFVKDMACANTPI
jgi:hypothetical protein